MSETMSLRAAVRPVQMHGNPEETMRTFTLIAALSTCAIACTSSSPAGNDAGGQGSDSGGGTDGGEGADVGGGDAGGGGDGAGGGSCPPGSSVTVAVNGMTYTSTPADVGGWQVYNFPYAANWAHDSNVQLYDGTDFKPDGCLETNSDAGTGQFLSVQIVLSGQSPCAPLQVGQSYDLSAQPPCATVGTGFTTSMGPVFNSNPVLGMPTGTVTITQIAPPDATTKLGGIVAVRLDNVSLPAQITGKGTGTAMVSGTACGNTPPASENFCQ